MPIHLFVSFPTGIHHFGSENDHFHAKPRYTPRPIFGHICMFLDMKEWSRGKTVFVLPIALVETIPTSYWVFPYLKNWVRGDKKRVTTTALLGKTTSSFKMAARAATRANGIIFLDTGAHNSLLDSESGKLTFVSTLFLLNSTASYSKTPTRDPTSCPEMVPCVQRYGAFGH